MYMHPFCKKPSSFEFKFRHYRQSTCCHYHIQNQHIALAIVHDNLKGNWVIRHILVLHWVGCFNIALLRM